MAYGVKSPQFSGPDWLGAAIFDITAKPPAGYQHEQLQPLLRDLLSERFKLAVHYESKEIPAYALVIPKGGTRLRESATPRSYLTVRPGLISGNHRTMGELTNALAGILERPVTDRTGLTGIYDLKLEWTPDNIGPAPAGQDTQFTGPSLFTAVSEQLGLKLETEKVMADVVVVDHAERTPVGD